jgi:hypothetical protein
MIRLWKPEVYDQDTKLTNTISIIVKSPSREGAITQAQGWLKSLPVKEKMFFTGTDKPLVSDCLEMKEELFGVIVL